MKSPPIPPQPLEYSAMPNAIRSHSARPDTPFLPALAIAILLLSPLEGCGNGGGSTPEPDLPPDSARAPDADVLIEDALEPDHAVPCADCSETLADLSRDPDAPAAPDSLLDQQPGELEPGDALPPDQTGEVVQDVSDCETTCAGLECGTVGPCECGQCGEGLECSAERKCVTPADSCKAACEQSSYECGAMTSQCDCGSCGEGMICAYHQCEEDPCPMLCEGRECGVVGAWYLGVSCDCGQCAQGEVCDLYTWTCKCLPQCKDPVSLIQYECGDDHCGGLCGTCAEGLVCNAEHKCVGEGTP